MKQITRQQHITYQYNNDVPFLITFQGCSWIRRFSTAYISAAVLWRDTGLKYQACNGKCSCIHRDVTHIRAANATHDGRLVWHVVPTTRKSSHSGHLPLRLPVLPCYLLQWHPRRDMPFFVEKINYGRKEQVFQEHHNQVEKRGSAVDDFNDYRVNWV